MDQLETDRLIIRAFLPEDLQAAHAILDEDLEWSGPNFSLEQRRERMQLYTALSQWGHTDGLYGYRAVLLKQNQELVGICGFLPGLWTWAKREPFGPDFFGITGNQRLANLELEIGYGLSSSHRGHGYATEAARALVAFAFDIVQIYRVLACTDRSNTASANVMRRVGMRTATNPRSNWPGVVGIIDNPVMGD